MDHVLLVELKACKSLAEEHIAQILGYLRATRIEHVLLINFGAFKYEIKKYVLSDCSVNALPRRDQTSSASALDSNSAAYANLR